MKKTAQTQSIANRFFRGLLGLTLPLLFLMGLAGCATSSSSPDTQARQVDTLEGAPVLVNKVPRATYFIGEYDLLPEDIRAQTRPLAEKVAIAAVKKAKLDIVGPLTLFLPDWRNQSGGEVTIGVGYPVTGAGQLVPRFDKEMKAEFKCLAVTRPAGVDNSGAWQQLYVIAEQQGMQVSGDNRTVIKRGNDGYRVELQLGLL